ncbi:YesL family protein [Butyrivibrio sp. YAB3001]|uniref:YesL family protein n=1 Tax=Butyrivibrio sp. YAB3001 TaxID=1520812 RepID=UPI0008F68C24|nr:DUF624 domain-containing protein [Butyrivibrio sp. YAB3001]SFC09371.1 Uncharacterized membrane protein YesL [Butyrivibrio sp. YAB3001]
MGRFFDIDSPLMQALSKIADIMWINILTLIFAIPLILEQLFFLSPVLFGDFQITVGLIFWAWLLGIVFSIPLGPALTAMHFVLLKLVRNEDSYVTKSYFKSFKENFKQGAILQVIQFAVGGILLLDYMLMKDSAAVYVYLVFAIAIILFMISLYIFPLLSKFVNTVPGTLKNSALMAVLALPKTFLMALVSVIPLVILYFFDMKAMPIIILMGIAGPGFLCALLYNGTFKRFEPKVEEMTEEEELEAAIRKIDESAPEGQGEEH